MKQLALENEVEEYIQKHSNLTGENGKRVVVKNGHIPQRDTTTGMGPLTITQPRVDGRWLKKRFSSNILSRYLRRISSVDRLLPSRLCPEMVPAFLKLFYYRP